MDSSWVWKAPEEGSDFLSHSSMRVATARGAHAVATAKSVSIPEEEGLLSCMHILSRLVAASKARGGNKLPRQL
jgi:hypothetical protein